MTYDDYAAALDRALQTLEPSDVPLGVPVEDAGRITHATISLRVALFHALSLARRQRESLKKLVALCERQTDFNDDGDGMTLARARAVIGKPTWDKPDRQAVLTQLTEMAQADGDYK